MFDLSSLVLTFYQKSHVKHINLVLYYLALPIQQSD